MHPLVLIVRIVLCCNIYFVGLLFYEITVNNTKQIVYYKVKHFVHKTYVQTSSKQANVCVNSKQHVSLK